MEGAACGIPQIVPMYSGLAEWMAGAGCMIPCGSSQMNIGINTIGGVVDKNLFIAALDRMYHDREYRAEYGKKALERAGNPAYRWSTIGETFNRVLEGMVEAKYGTTEKRNDGSDN
jgi:glycosyltransferase involved in cell wall biosynthesis